MNYLKRLKSSVNHSRNNMSKEKDKENKSFLLRMDSRMMEALEKWADDEFRSINGQILWILEQSLKKNGRLSKQNKE